MGARGDEDLRSIPVVSTHSRLRPILSAANGDVDEAAALGDDCAKKCGLEVRTDPCAWELAITATATNSARPNDLTALPVYTRVE